MLDLTKTYRTRAGQRVANLRQTPWRASTNYPISGTVIYAPDDPDTLCASLREIDRCWTADGRHVAGERSDLDLIEDTDMLDLTKAYRTRDGHIVSGLEHINGELYTDPYPIRGYIHIAPTSLVDASWTPGGNFLLPGVSDFDLVEVVPATTTALDVTKPVQTRDGRKARIVDTNHQASKPNPRPILAIITEDDGTEVARSYPADGIYTTISAEPSDTDLVNVPEQLSAKIHLHRALNGSLIALAGAPVGSVGSATVTLTEGVFE